MLKHEIVKLWNALFNLVVNRSQNDTLHLNIQSGKLVSNFITRCQATGSQSPALKKVTKPLCVRGYMVRIFCYCTHKLKTIFVLNKSDEQQEVHLRDHARGHSGSVIL